MTSPREEQPLRMAWSGGARHVWSDEFREIHRWGGLNNLVAHRQVSDRPSRITRLREMVVFIRGSEGRGVRHLPHDR